MCPADHTIDLDRSGIVRAAPSARSPSFTGGGLAPCSSASVPGERPSPAATCDATPPSSPEPSANAGEGLAAAAARPRGAAPDAAAWPLGVLPPPTPSVLRSMPPIVRGRRGRALFLSQHRLKDWQWCIGSKKRTPGPRSMMAPDCQEFGRVDKNKLQRIMACLFVGPPDHALLYYHALHHETAAMSINRTFFYL